MSVYIPRLDRVLPILLVKINSLGGAIKCVDCCDLQTILL